MNKVTFATFDALVHDSPAFCEICASHAPVFTYVVTIDGNEGAAATGFCCIHCAPGFLRRLESIEASQWRAEEAALEDAELVES